MRQLTLFLIFTLFVGACDGPHAIYEEAWLRAHFAQNEAAFDALALQAAAHPEIETAHFCPDEACISSLIMPDDRDFWSNEDIVFVSHMRRLNFPNFVFWWRTRDGGIEIPNMGGADTKTHWVHYTYVTLSDPPRNSSCDAYEMPDNTLHGWCDIPLNETWAIRKHLTNVLLSNQCFDAREACYGSEDINCVPDFCGR